MNGAAKKQPNPQTKPTPSALRTLLPTLVIAAGGVGAGILRRMKWNLNRSGVQAHGRVLVFDTDETSQSSEGEFPEFDERDDDGRTRPIE